ncbi:hypothetical protein GYMLUDRAFT_33145 [Collybiopsis luxurians FD-317 M1]|nr:hypothetical protein GYMLUDRAFT_33145 [Collybiopsis luxurians FD-317 M1]
MGEDPLLLKSQIKYAFIWLVVLLSFFFFSVRPVLMANSTSLSTAFAPSVFFF